MENKSQEPVPAVYPDNGVVQSPSPSLGVNFEQSLDPGALSFPDPSMQPQRSSVSPDEPKDKQNILLRLTKRADVVLAILLVLSMLGVLVITSNKGKQPAARSNANSKYNAQILPLEGFADNGQTLISPGSVVVNGSLNLNGDLVITPSLQPSSPKLGQIYFDQVANQLAYYDGEQFVLLGSGDVVNSLGGLAGQVTLGGGLSAVGNQLVNSGVLSLGGKGGAIVLGGGLGMAGNSLQNTGVLNVIAGTDISVANDGNGNFTISNIGAGTGTVTSSGGTSGTIPLFTGAQNIEDSIITQSGLTATITGDLSVVTGGLSLSNALTVSNGGTGTASLAANGVIVGNGTSALSSVAAGGSGLCLLSTAGAPAWGACPGGAGVNSLNGLTGALSIANASAAGSTVTIDNATTAAKGIASFNSTNFSVAGGAVNTIQNINSAATPTFGGVNTNSITPSAALTVGSTSQILTLQGNGGTIITATSGANTTTVGFTAPTANVNLNFPALAAGTYAFCTTSGNCLGGGAGGANTSLSNLTGVAINTTLLPGTAGAVNLGSATFPFGDVFMAGTSGTPGTNNFRITGASTSGTRTITLPDATGTVCLTTGNCAGAGGGVTTSGGTIGTLPVFTGAQAIGDSLLSQSGGTVTVAGHLSLATGNQYQINGTQISSANLSNDANLAKLGSSQTFTGATNAFQNGVNSTNAFNVQNAAGTRVLTVDTTNGEVELGIGSVLDGRLVFNNVSNANTVTIVPGTPSANRTITLPNDSGVVCLDSGNCAGAGATLQTAYNFSAGGTTPKIKVDATRLGVDIQDADTTIAANLFNVRASNGLGLGQVLFGVGNTGDITIQSSANSTTALRLLTNGGTSVLVGDTQNGQVILGQSSTLNGGLVFNNSTNGNQVTLTTAVATGARTITLPNDTGTVCLTSGNCAGVGGTGDILQGGNSFAAAMTIGTNDAFDLNFETSGVTRLTVESDGSQVTLANNVDLILQGATAFVSNPQGKTRSEFFGAGATFDASSTVDMTVLGFGSKAGDRGTSIGSNVSNSGNDTVAIGANITVGSAYAIAIGSGSTAGGESIGLGTGAGAANANSIALGAYAATTASNQLVIGSNNDTMHHISHVVIGSGVTDSTPNSFTLQGTSGSGVDIAGADANIAGGQSTGNAFGGSINFEVSVPGVSGASTNSLSTVASLGGATGSALFQNVTDTVQSFRIKDQTGDNVFVVDNINSQIGIALGGNNTPSMNASGLEVKGAIRLSGNGGVDTYTTPDGASIGARLSVENMSFGASGQVIAVGLTSTSDVNSRAITVLDDRATAHQPSMAVISPNENQIGGFSWDGSNTDFYVKNSASSGGTIGLMVGSTVRFQATTAGADVTGVLGLTSLGSADNTNYLCRNSSNFVASCNTTGAGAAFVQGGNSFGALATLGTNDANDLAIERNNATVLTVGASDVTFSSNIDLLLQGATAYISNPQGQANSEAFGLSAAVTATEALAVGNLAHTDSQGAIAIGYNASASGFGSPVAIGENAIGTSWGVAIGEGANSGSNWGVAVGNNSTASLGATALGSGTVANSGGIAIGQDAATNGNNRIVIGVGADATADNQLVIGGPTSGGFVDDVYLGSGVTDSTPQNVTINATGGSGTDIQGASLTLAGGKGTGAGNGGAIVLQIATPSGNGIGLNTLSSVANFNGVNGGLLLQNAVNTVSALTVQNAAGTSTIFNVDTSNGRVGINTAAPTADLTFGDGTNPIINVLTRTTNAAGRSLTLLAGNAGSGASPFDGGSIILQGGNAAGTGSSDGGTVYLKPGLKNGGGEGGQIVFENTGDRADFLIMRTSNGQEMLHLYDTYATGGAGHYNGYLFLGGTCCNVSTPYQVTFSTEGIESTMQIGADDATDDNGNNMQLLAGSTSFTNGNGGSVILTAGDKNGSGTAGGVYIQNKADNTAAFRVLNAAGTVPLFQVDTTNSRVYVGDLTADSTGALLVLDTKNTSGDPTGIDGAMYYNSSRGKARCYEYGYWQDCKISARTTYHYSTDLFRSVTGVPGGGIDDGMEFLASGTGATNDSGVVSSVAGHPGVVQQSTGTTTTGSAMIDGTGGSGAPILLGNNNDVWRFEVDLRIPTLSTAGQPFTYRTGFVDSVGESTDGCYFRYSHGVNSGKWQGACRSNNTETTCDLMSTSGTTVAANTWYRLTVTVSGSSADFQADGSTTNGSGRCQVASNVPSGAGRGTGWGASIVKGGSGATAMTTDVDYIEVEGQLGTTR